MASRSPVRAVGPQAGAKLWDAFRKPIDEAFNRKSAERERATTELSARDRVVLEASKALEAANASGDAQQIRAAMQALEAALRGQALAAQAVAESEADSEKSQAVSAQDATETVASEQPSDASGETAAPAPAAPKPAARPVVAVRGDDRPGMKKDALQWRGVVLVPEIAEMVARVIGMAVAASRRWALW